MEESSLVSFFPVGQSLLADSQLLFPHLDHGSRFSCLVGVSFHGEVMVRILSLLIIAPKCFRVELCCQVWWPREYVAIEALETWLVKIKMNWKYSSDVEGVA